LKRMRIRGTNDLWDFRTPPNGPYQKQFVTGHERA